MSTEHSKPEQHTLRFPRRLRLAGDQQFSNVYSAKISRYAGPLIIYVLPNKLPYTRFGMSVSRRVGNAVTRNKIKRLLRETFRKHKHVLPTGYDVAVRVRPHDPLTIEQYRELLTQAVTKLDQRCRKNTDNSTQT